MNRFRFKKNTLTQWPRHIHTYLRILESFEYIYDTRIYFAINGVWRCFVCMFKAEHTCDSIYSSGLRWESTGWALHLISEGDLIPIYTQTHINVARLFYTFEEATPDLLWGIKWGIQRWKERCALLLTENAPSIDVCLCWDRLPLYIVSVDWTPQGQNTVKCKSVNVRTRNYCAQSFFVEPIYNWFREDLKQRMTSLCFWYTQVVGLQLRCSAFGSNLYRCPDMLVFSRNSLSSQ